MEEPIPSELARQLTQRVREQVELEIARNVTAVYEMTLPEIRQRRIEDREDEPASSMDAIRQFLEWVESAEIVSIEVDSYVSRATAHPGHPPAARVLLRVRYNETEQPTEFVTVWVRQEDTWYTTSLGKFHSGAPAR